jgi:quercetin dioxygenase-like cupin family protein
MDRNVIENLSIEERDAYDQQVYGLVARFAALQPEWGIQDDGRGDPAFEVGNYWLQDAFRWLNPDSKVPRPFPKGDNFASSIVMCPPGKGVGIHGHTTEEMFVVLEGRFLFLWGEEEQHKTVLEKFDAISFPGPVMRRFINNSHSTGYILSVVGGGDPPQSIVVEDFVIKRQASR